MRGKREAKRALSVKGVLVETSDQSDTALLEDLSETGAKIRTSLDLREGERLHLGVELFLGGPLFSLPAQVIRKHKNEVGLRFLVLDSRLSHVLKSLIHFHRAD